MLGENLDKVLHLKAGVDICSFTIVTRFVAIIEIFLLDIKFNSVHSVLGCM